jgi:uncharacterized protein YcbK (DUF882 family)
MKILKFTIIVLTLSLITFIVHFNNINRVNPVVANYYLALKKSLKEKGFHSNLLVVSTKRSKWENNLFERFSVAAPNSRHLVGEAIDFLVFDINSDGKINGKDVDIVYEILNDEIVKDQGGAGTYKKQGLITRQMIHIDCRGFNSR